MRPVDRRQFLTIAGFGALSLPASALLSACSGDDTEPTSAATGSQASETPVGPLKIALSSSTLPTYITDLAGPLLYGKDFGLTMTPDDIVTFQSHATAVQAALSGQVQVVGASTMAHLSVIAQGSPFRMFSPYILVDTYCIAAESSIKSLADVKNAAVAVDSEGGAARTGMDAILKANDVGFLVKDIENVNGIESSGGRASALQSGDVQVALVHIYQANAITADTGKELNILGTLYESSPLYVKEAYAAPQSWLDSNQATAAALTASVIKASRELASSEETFMSAVKELLPEPPSDDQLALSFELINKYKFWPANPPTGLETERIEFMIALGKEEGLLTNPSLEFATVVDTRPLEAAQALVESSGSSADASSPASAPTTSS